MVRNLDGTFVTTFKDNISGSICSNSVTEFLSSADARFVLSPLVQQKDFINTGDTIGRIISNDEEVKIQTIEGELNVQKATLRLFSTGEKNADVDEAANRLSLAKQELMAQKQIFQRYEALNKDTLITQFEFENAQNQLKAKELNVAIAEAFYRSVTSGDKPEQTGLIETRIRALDNQIRLMKERQSKFTVISPVSGYLVKKKRLTEDVTFMMEIADTSGFVAQLPVEYHERDILKPGLETRLKMIGCWYCISGKTFNVDNTVQLISGKQAIYVSSLFESTGNGLMPGIVLEAKIYCDAVTPAEYISRTVRKTFY